VTLGEQLFLKVYRRLQAGVSVELEMGRFLTEVVPFANCVPVAGAVEYLAADGTAMTLGLLQAYVANEGDGWSYTLEYLQRYLEERRATTDAPPADAHGAYLALLQTLGTRTAELHRALGTASGDPAFDPEPVSRDDVASWKKRVRDEAGATLDLLERARSQLPAPSREAAERLLGSRDRPLAKIDAADAPANGLLKTRYHGDYHLGQVLLAKNDFIIIDFEGEPERPLAERRRKDSPLRDVAGMLRSFDYARRSALRNAALGEAVAGLAPFVDAWETEARRSFLQAYDEAASAGSAAAALGAGRALLELFELEKALYELRYEIGNRPGWADIPLLGILKLIGGPTKADGDHDGKA